MCNFKQLFVIFHFVLFAVIISCAKPPKEFEVDKIQVRNGLYYVINEEQPLTGMIVDFFKNGQKHIQIEIQNGKPEGKVIYWYENGCKDRELSVEGFDAQIEGSKFDFKHTNHLILDGWYIKYSKEKCQKEVEGNYQNQKRNGQWIQYHLTGQKMAEGNFKNDEADGKWVEWYESGQKQYENSWKDGKKDGRQTEWDTSGIKKSETNFKEGKKHGKLFIFDKNAKKQLENNYLDGVLADVIVYDPEIWKTYHLDSDDASLLLESKISNRWKLDNYRAQGISSETWNYVKDRLTFSDYGDFNADGKIDVAIGARSRQNSNESKIFVLWGPSFDSYAEIGWSKPFSIVKAGKISGWDNTSLEMKGDGIQMVQVEVSAWIMYWDEGEFKRFQTSD